MELWRGEERRGRESELLNVEGMTELGNHIFIPHEITDFLIQVITSNQS